MPNAYLAQFPGVEIEVRQYYDAMVKHIDDVVGNVTAALKAKGMWDNLLFITTSDNGERVCGGGGGRPFMGAVAGYEQVALPPPHLPNPGGPLADGVIDGLVGTSGASNYPLRCVSSR